MRSGSPHGGTTLRFREGAWGLIAVPRRAGASLWGGPESALGEMGEWSGLMSHSGYRSHFCWEGLVIVTVR